MVGRVVLIAGLLAGIVLLAIRDTSAAPGMPAQQQQVIHESATMAFDLPTGVTPTERMQAFASYANGESLPSGYTIDFESRTTAKLTGISIPSTGERQVLVTVLEETADIDELRVYLDGVLQGTATRASGGIVDRGGLSLASVTILVPAFPPYEVESQWDSVSNSGNKSSFEF